MLESALSYVVPFISVLLSYILGRLQSAQSDKQKARKEAYDNFYLPFIREMYSTAIWDTGFSRMNPNQRHRFFNLVVDNIRYMDKDELAYIDILYSHYSWIVGIEVGLDINKINYIRTNEVFSGLVTAVLRRAETLAKSLHQPALGQFVLQLWNESSQEREELPASELQTGGRTDG